MVFTNMSLLLYLVYIKPDSTKSVLSVCSMNVRSARERLTSIADHVSDHECDTVGPTETWLTDSVNYLPLIQLWYCCMYVPYNRNQGCALEEPSKWCGRVELCYVVLTPTNTTFGDEDGMRTHAGKAQWLSSENVILVN